MLGLGYPGGPALEACARDGDATRFPLPRALLGRKDCDFSFSGLKTAAAKIAHEQVKTEQDRADLCASVQAAITRQLVERSQRAMDLFKTQNNVSGAGFVVAGGVAANQAIRTALTGLAERNGFVFHAPPLAYCTDNGAMIALAGLEHYQQMRDTGEAERLTLAASMATLARPRWPLDPGRAEADPVHKTAGRKGAKA